MSADGADVAGIEKRVVDTICEHTDADPADITRKTSFIGDLSFDSLDTIELVMEIEDEFGMSIPDEEAEKIQTVGAVVDYIVNVVQSKSQE